MGITLDPLALERELDCALRDAASGSGAPLWADRVKWLGEQTDERMGKTYIAALGAALLAKATEPEVDSLTQLEDAGPNAYTIRGVAEFLQRRVRGRVHLGTLSKNPVNNSPFYKGPGRIDRFKVAGYMIPIYEQFRDWLEELNGYTQEQAHEALVAFLRERAGAQRRAVAAAAASLPVAAARSLDELIDVLQLFITENPEGGGRGQALVGAVLDCGFDDVEVVPKNHPAPFDVKRAGTPPPLVVEVKQTIITPQEAMDLAARASAAESSRALYAALDPSQPPLPEDRLRADALRDYAVFFDVCRDLRELVARLAAYSDVDAALLASELPRHAVKRCRSTGVSAPGQKRLSALLQGVSRP
jgi:hypothetical protein